MSDTVLAVLLVNSSAKGANLVFRWPPSPVAATRLSRALPMLQQGRAQLDNPWRSVAEENTVLQFEEENEESYQWKRPDALRDRSLSFSRASHTSSRRNSPATRRYDDIHEYPQFNDDSRYDDIFGYSSEFLAGILCPPPSLCHAKFELVVDDLAFIGHPVCTESDGVWRFKPEPIKPNSRGRGSRNRQTSLNKDAGPSSAPAQWLQTFHFVVVIDLPDPSSSASGNVAKYFDVLYEQVVFPVTAVLFQEQVIANFIETECDLLGTLKDSYWPKKEPFDEYVTRCLASSSMATALKSLYDGLKSNSMAYITINNMPLEVQLPPNINMLLRSEDDQVADFFINAQDDDECQQAWGPEMSVGWRLPSLTPWKSLLLLDDPNLDPYVGLRGNHVSGADRPIAEGLIKLLDVASITLSLAEMASLLDWELESQMFPTVRWLVQHRRAKVVDLIHPGLKTVFTLPPKFDKPLSTLSDEFDEEFKHPSVPCLAQILAAVSSSTSGQGDSHFFAAVVRTKDMIPVYHGIVLWMLRHDMLVTMHLRVRIVASAEIKQRAHEVHERNIAQKLKLPPKATATTPKMIKSPPTVSWVSMSPKGAGIQSRRINSNVAISPSVIEEEEDQENSDGIGSAESDHGDIYDQDEEEDEKRIRTSSIIPNPAQATAVQRRWLATMSEGKDYVLARRFEQINQYFDGKKTDDEILHKAEITRRELREVLHHYEQHLQTFLHSS